MKAFPLVQHRSKRHGENSTYCPGFWNFITSPPPHTLIFPLSHFSLTLRTYFIYFLFSVSFFLIFLRLNSLFLSSFFCSSSKLFFSPLHLLNPFLLLLSPLCLLLHLHLDFILILTLTLSLLMSIPPCLVTRSRCSPLYVLESFSVSA